MACWAHRILWINAAVLGSLVPAFELTSLVQTKQFHVGWAAYHRQVLGG